MTGWLRGVFGADDAADAAREGSEIAALAQEEGLEYLKDREQIPNAMRDQALTGLGAYYQVPGQQLGQQELIDQARQSPLYASIMGTQEKGEEALMRNASATGGLRSGGNQHDIYKYSQQLEQDALLSSYDEQVRRQDYERGLNLQGLTGLAGISGNENAIAGLTAGIGKTRAQGLTGAAQAKVDGTQAGIDTILGIGSMAATAFSDIRLKDDIRFLAVVEGFNVYGWTWNDLASKLGLEGECSGVLAHEVHETHPEATTEKSGYIQVDYGKLALENF